MNLYDHLILQVRALAGAEARVADVTQPWPVVEREELVLRGDTGMELGGGSCFGLGGLAFTTDPDLVGKDRIWIRGPGLDRLPETCHYGRFVTIRLNDRVMERESQEIYGMLRRVDHLRYHLYLKGTALRISSMAHREVLRISRTALSSGISLEAMARTSLEAFKKLDFVEAVQITCFTDQDAEPVYRELGRIALSCEEITESMNEIFKGISMDCTTCGQKNVCDAIDGLKELHEMELNKSSKTELKEL